MAESALIRQAVLILAAGFAVSAPLASAAQARELYPAGDWEIESDDESCTISRPFSALGEVDTRLYIRTYGPQAAAQVSISGPSFVRDDSRSIVAQVSFGDEDPDGEVAAIATTFRGAPMVVFQMALPRPHVDQTNSFGRGGHVERPLRAFVNFDPGARVMTIDAQEMEPQTIRIGAMGDKLAGLHECEQALVDHWGFDHAQQSSLARMPELTNRDRVNYWIIYPPNLMLNRISKIVQFRARVDENGEVDECIIQAPAWNSRYLRQSCRAITQGAQFNPALDANGNPVPALWRATMIFVMFD